MPRTLLTSLVVTLSCIVCADSERDLVFDQVLATGDARIEVGITNDSRWQRECRCSKHSRQRHTPPTAKIWCTSMIGRRTRQFGARSPTPLAKNACALSARHGAKDHHGCGGDRQNHWRSDHGLELLNRAVRVVRAERLRRRQSATSSVSGTLRTVATPGRRTR